MTRYYTTKIATVGDDHSGDGLESMMILRNYLDALKDYYESMDRHHGRRNMILTEMNAVSDCIKRNGQDTR